MTRLAGVIVLEHIVLEVHLIAQSRETKETTQVPKDNPAPPDFFGSMDGTVQLQLVILVTTIVSLLYQVWSTIHKGRMEERNRKWDQEDRERARQLTRADTARVERKIDQNTDLTQQALVSSASSDDRLASVLRKFDEGAETVVIREEVRELQVKPNGEKHGESRGKG